ncbi:thioredoxin-dependent thiol peroxidase [Chitinophagaceae bacterium MMS25-I14]
MELTPGKKAPDFTLNDQNGQSVSLHDFKGKKVVLYFYPKDDTPTCTAQACNLRDNIAVLKNKGIIVLGVSIDPEKKHKKFEQKYSLPFPLLTDPDKMLVEKYGVWGLKKFMGREYMGTHRVTFLINEKGIIDHIIDKVDSKNHTAQIMEVWNLS